MQLTAIDALRSKGKRKPSNENNRFARQCSNQGAHKACAYSFAQDIVAHYSADEMSIESENFSWI